MVLAAISCPSCAQAEAVYRHGTNSDGSQRYRCTACRRTFQLTFRRRAHDPAVAAQIVALALNGSGIRDTARTLRISTNTVLAHLKKNSLHSPRRPSIPPS